MHALLSVATRAPLLDLQSTFAAAEHWFAVAWGSTVGLANSTFGAALVASFAGAVGGAYGIELIARRRHRASVLRDEFSATLRALALTFNCTHTFIALKAQNIAPMYEEYARGRSQYEAARASQRPIYSTHNLFTIQSPSSPIEALQKLILERVRLTNRPVIVLDRLALSIAALQSTIKSRNDLCIELRQLTPDEVQTIYFSVGRPGHEDLRFSANVDALLHQTDACIYFALALSQLLERHAQRVALSLRGANIIPHADFSKSKAYLPNAADFLEVDQEIQAWLHEPLAPVFVED